MSSGVLQRGVIFLMVVLAIILIIAVALGARDGNDSNSGEVLTEAPVDRTDIMRLDSRQATLEAVQATLVNIDATRAAQPDSVAVQGTAQAKLEEAVEGLSSEIREGLGDVDIEIEQINAVLDNVNSEIAGLGEQMDQMAVALGDADRRLLTLEAPITATAAEATRRFVEVCFILPALREGAVIIYTEPDIASRMTGEYVTEDEEWIAVGQLGGTDSLNWWQVSRYSADTEIIGWVPYNSVRRENEQNCAAKPIVEPG